MTKTLKTVPSVASLALALLISSGSARAAEPFDFQNYKDPLELAAYLRQTLPVGTSKESAERTLVTEGQATAYPMPFDPQTIVYLYDVNLCDKYVWRWNVNAKYDATGILEDLYLYDQNIHDPGKKYTTRRPASSTPTCRARRRSKARVHCPS